MGHVTHKRTTGRRRAGGQPRPTELASDNAMDAGVPGVVHKGTQSQSRTALAGEIRVPLLHVLRCSGSTVADDAARSAVLMVVLFTTTKGFAAAGEGAGHIVAGTKRTVAIKRHCGHMGSAVSAQQCVCGRWGACGLVAVGAASRSGYPNTSLDGKGRWCFTVSSHAYVERRVGGVRVAVEGEVD